MDGRGEAVGVENRREIRAEFGEDGVADIAAGMGDGPGEGLHRPIGTKPGAGERAGDDGEHGDGEKVNAVRGQNAVNLLQSGVEVGDMFEGLGGQDKVECAIGVGQAGQVLATDAVEGRSRFDAVEELGEFVSGQPPQLLMNAVDAVDLGDAKGANFVALDPFADRRGRRIGRISRQKHVGQAAASQLRAAVRAIVGLLVRHRFGDSGRHPPQLFQLRRNHPPSVQPRAEASADRTSPKSPMPDRARVLAEPPGEMVAAIPERKNQPFQRVGNARHRRDRVRLELRSEAILPSPSA